MDFRDRRRKRRQQARSTESNAADKAASEDSAEKVAEDAPARATAEKPAAKPAAKAAAKKPRTPGRIGRLVARLKTYIPKTRRGKIIFYIAAGLLGISMLGGGGVAVWSSFPSFCKSCHHITPYYESWQTSVHGKEHVACTDCHFTPGAVPYIMGKVNGMVEVFKYFSHSYGPKLRSEVQDVSCLRSGCHAREEIDEKRKSKTFKKVRFSHTKHFENHRAGIELRCASCHSQSLHSEDGTVSSGLCFSCHLTPPSKDATPEALAEFKRASDCKTCHDVPKEVATGGGFKFDHGKYASKGSDCSSCHSHVTHGKGGVPARQCELCHNEGTAGERKEYAQKGAEGLARVHDIHVHKTQVECFECHEQMLHGASARAIAASQSCDACHDSSHVATRALYEGSGGAVKGEADPMASSGVRCEGCHKGEKRGRLASAVCTPCHEKEFDRLGGRWKSAFDIYVTRLDAARVKAQSLGLSGDAPKQLLADAARDIAFVRDGRGAHNVKLAVGRLRSAQAGLSRLLVDAGAAGTLKILPVPEKAAARCLERCHVGVETTGDLKYADKAMPHGAHVMSARAACSDCHDMTPEKHKTTLTDVTKNCGACHHRSATAAAGDAECASCHPRQEMVFAKATPKDARARHSTKPDKKVKCLDCHVGIAEAHSRDRVRGACVKCHKLPAFGRILDEWQDGTREAVTELGGLVARAKKVLVGGTTSREREAAIRAARVRALAALELVKSDGSAGAHNLEYLIGELSAARKVLLFALK